MSFYGKKCFYPSSDIKKKPNFYSKLGFDNQFIEQLEIIDQPLVVLGKRLLYRIREKTPGRFIYRSASRKFIESPNPFWAIQIEKQFRRFCMVVLGKPDEYRPTQMIKLYKIMVSYSVFYLDNGNQVDEAIKKIVDAKQIMRTRRKLNYQ